MASRASEKMNNSPCPSRCWSSGHAAGKRPLLHGIYFLLVFSNPPGVYKPPAVPSGAAQGAHYPAEDIQAVTLSGSPIQSCVFSPEQSNRTYGPSLVKDSDFTVTQSESSDDLERVRFCPILFLFFKITKICLVTRWARKRKRDF